MKAENVTVSGNGRIVLPVIFRKQLNIKPGDELILSVSPDNDIVIHSPKQSLRKLQELFKNTDGDFVEELLEIRRNEKI